MKIAVIGAGIAGLVATRQLYQQHEVTLFEAQNYLGGHTHTVTVAVDEQQFAVDTGFIVFNDRTYPNFIKLLQELGVAFKPTEMSFSIHCQRTGLEYNGRDLNTLFAQRRNLIRPQFYRMLVDILRFNRFGSDLERDINAELSLGELLYQHRYSKAFADHYLLPMGAAIWSALPTAVMAMPARFFIEFFRNHGLLTINNRPQWYVVEGGSREYVKKLIQLFAERVRIACPCPIKQIRRTANHVELELHSGEKETFDQVIIATHSDQALQLLAEPSRWEQAILGAMPYQENEVVLHIDTRLLPKRRLAWAAWNYHIPAQTQQQVAVSYNMNILQGLQAPRTFVVTLNNSSEIDPSSVLMRTAYHHPVFNQASLAAQQRYDEINGVDRIWYCGAYWGHGFHEDGVNSALRCTAKLIDQKRAA